MRETGYLVTLLVAVLMAASCNSGSSSAPPTPPAALSGLSATPGDGYVLISAAVASGVTGANLYWSTASGVSKTNGTKIMVGEGDKQAHTGLNNGTTYYYVATTISAGVESRESTQVSATPVAVTAAVDPLYSEQWHLKNTGQSGAGSTGIAGQDLNVEPVWTTNKGSGVRVAVVDDGLEIAHEDLAANVAANDLSYNYVTSSNDPTNPTSDATSGHGTAVAGIIAARDSNGVGVSGVAPRANLVGYNFLQSSTTVNEADALTRGAAAISVFNNSWGPGGGNGNLSSAPSIFASAIDTGLTSGRGGKGSVYVFAAGNGAPQANSNYHGVANAHGVMAAAAVNDQGKQSIYSESGANLWISAPGGEFCDTHTITTTDRTGAVGENPPAPATGYADYVNTSYTRCMNGTSSATPGVSGVVALMLAANSNLGWRDVRLILAQSARMNDATDAGWFTNGGGFHFNHKYGFGVADANAAVTLASGWSNVGAEVTQSSTTASPNTPIPDATLSGSVVTAGAPVTSTITVAAGAVTNIEYMEITFSAADHTYMGDLEVTLSHTGGATSRLAETHACLDTSSPPLVVACTAPYNGWVFGSSAHLGESPAGTWTLTVTDRGAGDTGHLQSWGMKFYGR
jgi:kexin